MNKMNMLKAFRTRASIFLRKGWCFCRNVTKATILTIKRAINKGRVTFVEELVVTDTEDWGASMSVERSGKTLRELNSKTLSASGTPACTAECHYYMEINGERIQISPEKFFNLIPKR